MLGLVGLNIAYVHKKFDHCSFSHSGDTADNNQNLNGSRDLTTPLSGIVCHPWASTSYKQPIYQLQSLYLYPL